MKNLVNACVYFIAHFFSYAGGNIDDRNIGEVPFPWDIPASPPEYFKNHIIHLEVPHTASIKTCHVCGGVGRKRCSTCSGCGWVS